MDKDIIVVGDLHGDFGDLNALITKKQPDIVLACGDFGYWPMYKPTKMSSRDYKMMNYIDAIKPQKTRIYFCDGNHENHALLDEMVKANGWRQPIEVRKNIFYCPRGSTLTLPDGRIVMFMGGAESIDKAYRTPGLDWFPQETISYNDVAKLDREMLVDIFITHTCSECLVDAMLEYNKAKWGDPSTKALQAMYEMYHPGLWYFGHWHSYKTGTMNDNKTLWTCLSHPRKTGWWCYLD